MKKIMCKKLKKEAEALDYLPYPGEIGKKIQENTIFSTDIRNLMNHLMSKEKASKSDNDEGNNTKGLINASHKTILTVVNIEDGAIENDKKPNDIDMVIDCHKGHPELSPSDLGFLKFRSDPKPRAVREGSEVIVVGSIMVIRYL